MDRKNLGLHSARNVAKEHLALKITIPRPPQVIVKHFLYINNGLSGSCRGGSSSPIGPKDGGTTPGHGEDSWASAAPQERLVADI